MRQAKRGGLYGDGAGDVGSTGQSMKGAGRSGALVELLTRAERTMNSAGRLPHPLIILHSSDSIE